MAYKKHETSGHHSYLELVTPHKKQQTGTLEIRTFG